MKQSTIKSITKTGMTLSMASLIWSGMKVTKGNHRCHTSTVHTWSGIALIGFSVWHYNTYQKVK